MRVSYRLLAVVAVLAVLGPFGTTANAQRAPASVGELIRGELVDEAGGPLRDALVHASLISADEPGTESDSRRRNLLQVGQMSTTSDGQFAFSLGAQSVARQYVGVDGQVDLRLRFFQGGEWVGAYAITLYPGDDPRDAWRPGEDRGREIAEAAKAEPAAIRLTIGGQGVTDERRVDAETIVRAADVEPVEVSDTAEPEMEDNQATCTESVVATYYNVETTLMTGGSNSSVVRVDYKYATSDSHTVGVAFSLTGAFGSYSASGTKTAATVTTINYPARTSASTSPSNNRVSYKTDTRYRKWETRCSISYPPVIFYDYEVRPHFIEGDADVVGVSWKRYKAPRCISLAPGTGGQRQTGQTIHYNNGVKLGSPIGLDVEVKNTLQGGNSHEFTWDNLSSSGTKYVCGQYEVPGCTCAVGGILGDWRE